MSRGSESLMAPTQYYSLDGLGRNFLCLFLGSPGFNWCIVVFFFCCFFLFFFLLQYSSVVVLLFDNPEIPKCLIMLFLLSPHLCFIIGFIYDLSVARNDSWMSKKTSTRTEHIYIFFHYESWLRARVGFYIEQNAFYLFLKNDQGTELQELKTLGAYSGIHDPSSHFPCLYELSAF